MNDELMALMVHDLKNPLAALLANLGFVGSVVAGDEMAKEAIDDCTLSTEVLSRLIDNMSAISKLGEPGATTPPGECSAGSVLRACEVRMQRHAAAAGLSLQADLGPDLGQVGVSAQLLELAVDNLLASALAYTPPGAAARLGAERTENRVRIVVTDAGPAVAEEMRQLIPSLEGQLRLKGERGARYARGLGLHVAALIARATGGDFVVTAPAAGGCAIEMLLPSAG